MRRAPRRPVRPRTTPAAAELRSCFLNASSLLALSLRGGSRRQPHTRSAHRRRRHVCGAKHPRHPVIDSSRSALAAQRRSAEVARARLCSCTSAARLRRSSGALRSRFQRYIYARQIARTAEIKAGYLLDPAESVSERVAVDMKRCARRGAVEAARDESLQRALELAVLVSGQRRQHL